MIIEIIARPKIEGSQSFGTLGQALLPILAVTREDSNPSLLPKQAYRLGPWPGALRVAALYFRSWDYFKNYMVELSMKSP